MFPAEPKEMLLLLPLLLPCCSSPAGAGKPLVVAYGGPTPPSNIDDLLDNMESPLTKIDVR
jgi:hypothetical protein